MSHENDDRLYARIHDECYSYMMDELMVQYEPVLHTLEGDESEIFAQWLNDRAVKFADERAPEIFDEQ